MIYTGLTSWTDHPDLYTSTTRKGEELAAYAAHFPIVEMDTSFYAVPNEAKAYKWLQAAPDSFQFVIKAYQGMTGHQRGESPYASKEEMFAAFREGIKPFEVQGRLAMVLCQFPPWFDCRQEHVDVLRRVRTELSGLPAALEFRHQSWFKSKYYDRTLSFMEAENWIHTVCDEPQVGEGSVPSVVEVTHDEKSLIRLHGRNSQGWRQAKTGPDDESWRKVRYLYDYSAEELKEWVEAARRLEKATQQVYVIFNNNSGGHAAKNAQTFLELAGITYEGLAPKQLNLFDDGRTEGGH
ncbi:uncharacterized protein YecE (DUF72 family) [Salsuginibacillus halophilus]|uniref:Uncharacterized protein YecE (DUF72 family) n=1 Tax=Salsuginibacillus halophilus TaxID=517424 RepID=A0A2P8HE05_9BACI|nr:DUF72 domain-containing protein [Salsuginibacillus halophilus]PSL44435.1 uncharacterized protein YecE (DUF72 family) [Salsuginibacillus halophilus]